MTRAIHLISVHLLCLLAACGETGAGADTADGEGASQEPAVVEIELCDAADYRPLVGTSVAATTFEASRSLRVFGVNDIVTQDYIPQRTNVVYDEDGTITRVYCG